MDTSVNNAKRKNISMPADTVDLLTSLAKANKVKQWQLAHAAVILIDRNADCLAEAVEIAQEMTVDTPLSKRVKTLTVDQQAKIQEMLDSGEL